MKKEYQGQCIFCGQPASSNQAGVGYTKTRRKTINLFHEKCFKASINNKNQEVQKWQCTQ